MQKLIYYIEKKKSKVNEKLKKKKHFLNFFLNLSTYTTKLFQQ